MRVRETSRGSPDLAGYKHTSEVKYVVSLRLLTAWFSVLAFGPHKDKILASKCMNTSFSQPYLLLKLLQSLSFLEVHHKYPGQVAEDIHSPRLVKNCGAVVIFVTNSLPQTHFLGCCLVEALWVWDYHCVLIYFTKIKKEKKKIALTILQYIVLKFNVWYIPECLSVADWKAWPVFKF